MQKDAIQEYLQAKVARDGKLMSTLRKELTDEPFPTRPKRLPPSTKTISSFKNALGKRIAREAVVEQAFKKYSEAGETDPMLNIDDPIRLVESTQDYQTGTLKNEFVQLLSQYIRKISNIMDIYNYYMASNPYVIEELVLNFPAYEPQLRRMKGTYVDEKLMLSKIGNMVLGNVNQKYGTPMLNLNPIVDPAMQGSLSNMAIQAEDNALNTARAKTLPTAPDDPSYDKATIDKTVSRETKIDNIIRVLETYSIEEETALFKELNKNFKVTKKNYKTSINGLSDEVLENLYLYVDKKLIGLELKHFKPNPSKGTARDQLFDAILAMDYVQNESKTPEFYAIAKRNLDDGKYDYRSNLTKKMANSTNIQLDGFYNELLVADSNRELDKADESFKTSVLNRFDGSDKDPPSSSSFEMDNPMRRPVPFSPSDLSTARLKPPPPKTPPPPPPNKSMKDILSEALDKRRLSTGDPKDEEDNSEWDTEGDGLKLKKVKFLRKGETPIGNKYFIDHDKLDNNILEVRYKKNRHLTQLKSQYVGHGVKKIISDVTKIGTLDTRDYKKLGSQEKHLIRSFLNMIQKGDLIKEDGQDFNEEFQVLMGSYNAGNNSELLKRQLKQMILYGIRISKIPRSTGLQMIEELN